ncbi:MAG TPA: Rid family detoxifying hydrolase [Gaiellales bacterium]|jgi:2-iminobutanoate/2-iminopropanoate deaminase|nr:Rid family detoxifying hydrolase [Gaiellales bacterium]
MSERDVIVTEGAPKPFGGAPYNQAIRAAGLVFCAGQVGLDPAAGTLVDGGVEAQARRAMDNLSAVLEAAGSGIDRIVKTTIFVTDLGDFATVNAVYGSFFAADPPARSTVQVAGLPGGAVVEIEAIALA